ncbi:trehalase family glycosidase [Pseudoalteromonas viridis]|uniref:Alpha,alpha-trehalase n=1 Tax=Pseudoalteromonas viridis TaxID=339617 RepID=A0ABX7VFJ9_9GAMM|nr:trehalase family glycosidase [Pseudoalteromonas viridis]QTL38165.1 alpha,alpha-trehalase [Pseudoalteromonas viridis]
MQFEQSNLFKAVQMQGIFSDSKHFADAIPKVSWEQACAQYEREMPEDLAAFVAQHFEFAPQPELAALNATSVKDYISQLWSRLERAPQAGNASSLLDLPASYTVPGGRFNEIYYWDSYFTALGLLDAGRTEQVSNMLDNFVSLIARIGHVPNGNRSYYTSRSQPPVTALMVSLLWQTHHRDQAWLQKVTEALQAEHAFWMAGSDKLNDELSESRRVVRMPCGGVMNRFWDDSAQPRPESYKEDIEAAALLEREHRAAFYRNIRAACESGWDFSSRWLDDPAQLCSINTVQRIPVDLNALLHQLEWQLSECYAALGQAQQSTHFLQLAQQRKRLIQAYLWDKEQGWFMDYHTALQTRTQVMSLAAVVPMFLGLASQLQAEAMMLRLEQDFLKAGGLVTTLTETDQQWDSPNGWAPLQWFAVKGLLNYGNQKLATSVARRWLAMLERDFEQHGCLLEKYNVVAPGVRAGGGEYLVQQGFGWTNGVTSRFYQLLES